MLLINVRETLKRREALASSPGFLKIHSSTVKRDPFRSGRPAREPELRMVQNIKMGPIAC